MASIDDVFNLLSASLPEIKQEIETVKALAQSNQRALKGTNGTTGLVSQVNSLCTGQTAIRNMVQDHDNLLYKGKDESEPGLVEQIRQSRTFQRTVKRLYWLFIGALVVSFINILLQFLPRLGQALGG